VRRSSGYRVRHVERDHRVRRCGQSVVSQCGLRATRGHAPLRRRPNHNPKPTATRAMESSALIAWSLASLVALLLWSIRAKHVSGVPGGRRALPFFGSLLELRRNIRRRHDWSYENAKVHACAISCARVIASPFVVPRFREPRTLTRHAHARAQEVGELVTFTAGGFPGQPAALIVTNPKVPLR
jgi:hypothetical protein